MDASSNPDETYVNEVLPAKMYYNLKSIENFGFFRDIGIMFKTVFAVLGKEYKGDYVPEKKDEAIVEESIENAEKVDNVCDKIEQNTVEIGIKAEQVDEKNTEETNENNKQESEKAEE